MPRPSALGVVLAFFAFMFGFAMAWHVTWLALAGLAGIVAACAVRAWSLDTELEVPAATLAGARP
jgi:cytochrome o ubiquinol oxidase subunit 1